MAGLSDHASIGLMVRISTVLHVLNVGLVGGSTPTPDVTVDWGIPLKRTNAVPTYLDQVNPLCARSAPLHDAVFKRITDLGADKIRYLHWDANGMCFPLLTPPVNGTTSWDFSTIDPYVIDFMEASAGHDSVINFAAPPKWYTEPCPNPPTCTNKGFLDETGTEAGKYFSRIISWYTKGGFVDELGVRHISNHSYNWTYWEVLNEVDTGSSGVHCQSWNNTADSLYCAQRYTQYYDGIVTVLKRDHPQLLFTGLVLAMPDCANTDIWFDYFLNASNHRSPVRENFEDYLWAVSMHWYSENGYCQGETPWPDGWRSIGNNSGDVFLQSAQFISRAKKIQNMVDIQAPWVKTVCNEIGMMAPAISKQHPYDLFGADRWWWNLEASQYAYVYGSLAAIGFDQMAASQLTGYPGNAPSISMLDWTNGEGTAWYWVVKMFIDTFGSDTKAVFPTYINDKPSDTAIRAVNPDVCIHTPRPSSVVASHVDALFAQGFVREVSGQKIVLLANTRNDSISVGVFGARGGALRVVDFEAGFRLTPWAERKLANDTVTLTGFGVGLVLLPSTSTQDYFATVV